MSRRSWGRCAIGFMVNRSSTCGNRTRGVRENSMIFGGFETTGPLFLRSHREGVYVARCTRVLEERRGDATHDHRRNSGRL